MTVNGFIKEVHDNAVAHGFWEEDRPYGETFALIHAELSEALEEYRAYRPAVWFACNEGGNEVPCNPRDEYDCKNFEHMDDCEFRGHKPEGIAIELIDAVIRIFDYLGRIDKFVPVKTFEELLDPTEPNNQVEILKQKKCESLPVFIAEMHSSVALAYDCERRSGMCGRMLLKTAVEIMLYVNANYGDSVELLQLKHNYNKTRAYKHGKRC